MIILDTNVISLIDVRACRQGRAASAGSAARPCGHCQYDSGNPFGLEVTRDGIDVVNPGMGDRTPLLP
jgi:hypothetical protein